LVANVALAGLPTKEKVISCHT